MSTQEALKDIGPDPQSCTPGRMSKQLIIKTKLVVCVVRVKKVLRTYWRGSVLSLKLNT